MHAVWRNGQNASKSTDGSRDIASNPSGVGQVGGLGPTPCRLKDASSSLIDLYRNPIKKMGNTLPTTERLRYLANQSNQEEEHNSANYGRDDRANQAATCRGTKLPKQPTA